MTSLELLYPTGDLAHFEVGFRLLLAVGLAALLGWDGEEWQRPAGLRTYMLVALAATLFTILTFEIYEAVRASHANADPIRLIEAVTAGVAFLAAGAIIHGRNTARGLTTGAAMWVAGALGVAVGAGHYLTAFLAAVLSFVILRIIYVLQPGSGRSPGPTLIIESVEDEDTGSRP